MNQTLTQIQEEFEEKYAAFEFCDQDNMTITKPQMKKLSAFLTQSNLRVIEKVKEMVEENNKWATENNEYDDEKWKIHYGGYKEAVKNILSDLSTLIEQK